MSNTFTPVTGNLLGHQVPLPGVATMGSGGVSPPNFPPPGQAYSPIKPLPTGPGTNSTAI